LDDPKKAIPGRILMRGLIAVAIVIVLCTASLTGCGSTPPADPSKAENASGGQVSGLKKENINLDFLCMGIVSADMDDFETVLLPKLISEKFPHITITAQKLPDDQFITTFLAKMASGEGPDLYYWWPLSLANQFIVKDNYARDITGSSALKNFNKTVIKAYSYQGRIFAVPSVLQLLGTYYNKSLFLKAGISEIPKDWPSFLDVCDKLKAEGITPIVMGDRDPAVIQYGLYQIAASRIYSSDKEYDRKLMEGHAKFSDKPWTDVLEKYKYLYDKGYMMEGTLGIGRTQAIQLFIDGKAAMTFDGSWDYNAIMKKGAADFERGFFPLPGNDKEHTLAVSVNPGIGTYINQKSKHPDETLQVLEYWFDGTSPAFKAWAEAYKNEVPSYEGLELRAPELQDFYKLFLTGDSYGFCNNYWFFGIIDVLQQKFQGVIGGDTSIAEVTKAMDDKVVELQNKNR